MNIFASQCETASTGGSIFVAFVLGVKYNYVNGWILISKLLRVVYISQEWESILLTASKWISKYGNKNSLNYFYIYMNFAESEVPYCHRICWMAYSLCRCTIPLVNFLYSPVLVLAKR